MTTVLRVIVDQILSPVPGGIGRYAEELTRELILTAPPRCSVAGVVSSSPPSEYERLMSLLPGLSDLHKSALARRELSLAWQHGFTRLPGNGMIHAPSILAPLRKHDRVNDVGDQTVVTIHDVVPWTHPETLTPRGVTWHRAMAKRAERYADAIVVPTHAVAAELSTILNVGDRVRVIGGAAGSRLQVPVDAEVRAARMNLPARYILSVGTLEPRKGLSALIRSLADVDAADIPLVIAGPDGWGGVDVDTLARDAGLPEGRVIALGFLSDADLAVAMSRATVFVFPSLAEGFGLPVVEAFSLGAPVVHSDVPAVVEVSAGAGRSVALNGPDRFEHRLAVTIAAVVDDGDLAERMRTAGLDRAAAFTWAESARQVWQLHADL